MASKTATPPATPTRRSRPRRTPGRYARAALDPESWAAALESLWTSGHDVPEGPQLFILGLPRTGTTLVYQSIVHRLEVSYFTNGVGRFPRAPCVTTWLQRRLYGKYRSDFTSEFGRVAGPVAPREAGGFWGRFFGFDDYVGIEDVRRHDVRQLQRTVACIQENSGGAPFVNKNVKHVLRIGALASIFPESVFLVVTRDPADVAISVYRARQRRLGDSQAWFSVKPPDYDRLRKLSPEAQISGQVRSLVSRLEADLADLPRERIVRIGYEAFCDDPEALIETVRGRLANPATRNSAVPRFERSRGVARTPEEQRLVRMVSDVATR